MAEKRSREKTPSSKDTPRLERIRQSFERMQAIARERQTMERQPTFVALKSRLDQVLRRYPDEDGRVAPGDAELYPALVVLARDGFEAVQQFDPYFLTHDLYDDGMFWYGLCQFTTRSAVRVEKDHAQAYIPVALVDELLDIFCQMSRYSGGGDISKRMLEAHGETLLTFYSAERLRAVRVFARSAAGGAKRHLKDVVAAVVAHRPPPKSPAHRRRR